MIALLLTALLLLALAPFLVPQVGRTLGYIIRQRTEERRQTLLARAHDEEKEYQARSKAPEPSEDDEWEKVENHPGRIASNGGQGEDTWTGVVGFFHPFW